ncbi:MAG: 23S rRNA (guanosine(2251)-2'-O)-methyltransferase RlmB [Gammaproteobacteria bacterium]
MSDSQRVFGLHAVGSLLQRTPGKVTVLLVQDNRNDARVEQLLSAAEAADIVVRRVPRRELDELAAAANHQGVVAEMGKTGGLGENDLPAFLDDLSKPAFVLVLDSIQDPHNLGACLRSADAAGVDVVIVPKDKSASVNATVRKVACGAAEVLPVVRVTNLARTLRSLKDRGIWIYGAAGEADASIYQTRFDGATAIVMGSEGKGLRRLTREHCDALFSIPMAGSVSSLNVSVATGICLFEVRRQQAILSK